MGSELKAGWKRVKFGDVVRNANLTERDAAGAGIERIVGLEHIDPENLHVRRWNTPDDGTSFTRKFVPGQTLFGKRRAYQRKVAFAEFDGICSGDILTFEPKDPSTLLPELLPFICQSDAFFDHALGTSAGSLSPRTSWGALRDFEFALPSLDEQKRIAEILWAFDDLISRYSNLATDAQFLAETTFLQRISQSNFAQKTLDDVTLKISDGEHLSPKFVQEGVPILSAKDILDEGVTFSGARYITALAGEKARSRCDPNRDDILIVSRGATIGRSCLVDTDAEFALMGSVIQIRPQVEKVLPQFLDQFFRLPTTKRSLLGTSGSTAQQAIYLTHIKNLRVPVPDISEQYRLISEVEAIQETARNAMQSNDSARACSRQVAGHLVSGIGSASDV